MRCCNIIEEPMPSPFIEDYPGKDENGISVITTLKWTIDFLAKYQDVQQKIQYEIKEIVGERKILTQAVLVNEYTVGYHIPKDSSLIVDVMSLHYDPSIFPTLKCLFHSDGSIMTQFGKGRRRCDSLLQSEL
ncbi:hypothetical protein C2G38_2151320 [Gigaspora rosea]|uniref:Uncharacterized protein n=1 Tax=Gigaspora rosea TaxID=44941 RepID=A0A397W8A6_9GLOM|nr:hypothetical protein C2G38_2151320 [Gigaspora rosea]